MDILVASSSPYRQTMYRDAIEKLGHQVVVAGSGVDCIEQLQQNLPQVLVLEAPLLWGGSDGVLDVAEQEIGPAMPPVIVLAVGSGSIDWFQLSRFKIDDFLFRVPTTQELGRAIASVAEQRRSDDNLRSPRKAAASQRPSGVVSETSVSTPWSGLPLGSSLNLARR
jgi:CheY-like chemotaxis protein